MRLAIQLARNLKKLSGAFWVKHGSARAKLADHGLECVLVLRSLLLEVKCGALEAQVVITGQY